MGNKAHLSPHFVHYNHAAGSQHERRSLAGDSRGTDTPLTASITAASRESRGKPRATLNLNVDELPRINICCGPGVGLLRSAP